ncbi:uncharacterized protein LOC141616931 [Silene latifolia]|uniref:uncharacterized protein LOC141616931 n=1 Tax=Silene latifolia TaxID=37657 RepID=UPI003D76C7F0
MGFDNDCILNIQSLAGEYFCAVCRTLVYPNEAIQGPCTHLYCKPCLAYVVSTTHACPYDGYRVTESETKPLSEANKTLADTIGKIQVHCLFYKTGCTWQGSLSDCTSHCSTCGFGESAVICNKCGVQLKHRQMQEHAQKCYGVHYQVQQPGGVLDNNSTGSTAAPGQTKTAVQTGGPVSQPTSQVSTLIVCSHDANQTANSATQPKVAQAAMPTAEQMYHQHLQNQQYLGFDPYQQIYRYYNYYPYPQAQAYPQAYGQPQPLSSSQTQAQLQPVVQAQQQVQQYQQPQAQAYPQVYGQPQPLSFSQTLAQTQPIKQAQQQVQPLAPNRGAEAPLQSQAQSSISHALYSIPAGPPSVAQPYTQPQPLPKQQLLVPQYPQTHPRMQHLPLPPYPHPQTQVHSQPPSEPNMQGPVLFSQQHIPPSTHLQTSHAVTGYQSYPQPQPHPQSHSQAQIATQHLSQGSNQMQGQFPLSQFPMLTTHMHPSQSYSDVPNQQQPAMLPTHAVTGYQSSPQPQPQSHSQAQIATQHLSQGSNQMQGQFPLSQFPMLTTHMHPPQSYSDVPNQQQPAQGPPPSGPPAQQPPTYAQAQQPGHLFQQRPSVQATKQAFPEHSPFKLHRPSMTAQVHSQVPSQMPPQSQQNYGQPPGAYSDAGSPLGVQAVVLPYAQPTEHAGTGQVRPQLNQNYPRKMNNELSSTDQLATLSQHVSSSEKSRDPVLEKGGQVRAQLNQTTNNQLSSAKQLATQTQHVSSSEEPCDQMLEKGVHDQIINNSKEDRDMAMASSAGSKGDEVKLKAKNNSGAIADERLSQSCLSGSKQLLDAATEVDNIVQEANPTTKRETVEGVSKTPGDRDKIVLKNESKKINGQDVKHTAKHAADTSALRKTDLQSQFHGENSRSSIDQRRNQQQPLPYGARKSGRSSMPRSMGHHVKSQQPAFLGHTSYKLRPQGPGQAPPYAVPLKNPSVGLLGPVSAGSLGKSGCVNYVKGNVPYHHANQPQNPSGDHLVRPTVTTHTRRPGTSGQEIDKFGAQRSGHIDDRQPASPPHGPIEQNFGHGAYGIQQGAVKIGGPSARGAMPVPGIRDEWAMPFFEQHSKHLPHKEFEDGFQKSLRPPHSEAEPSNFGMLLPSWQLDHGSLMFGGDRTSRSFQTEPLGFDRDPCFGRAPMDGLPPRSPAKDYPSLPSRAFGPSEDVGRNESWSFESSKPNNCSAEPSRKPTHKSRFPVHSRSNLHLGEHFAENHDSFEGEKPGHCLQGESGFENGQGIQHFAYDYAFNAREVDHMRKRKPGSMCQICNVECGTVEDLESHSQSSEHQRKARDTVVKIKEQNKKTQKVSRDREDGGKPKNSGFQGH